MTADFDGAATRDIFAVSPDPIFVHDPDTGAVVDANEAALDLLGLDRAELAGRQIGSFSPPEFSTEAATAAIKTAATEGSTEVDWAVVGPEGDQRWVTVTLKRATVDGDARVVAFVRDVSERREREHATWSERLQTILDNLPVVVFTLDPSGVFTNSAGKGLEALNVEQGQLVGSSVFEQYADYPDIIAAVERALDGEEVRVTQPIGGLVFETWYRPVMEDGELSQVVGVARNITELTRREKRVDALSEATNELLYTHTEPAVAERVTAIAEDIIDRPIAAMWSYDADADVLVPIGATTTATDFAGVEIAQDLPEIGTGTDEKAIFDAGEPVAIRDYGELDTPSAPGVPLGTMLCLPLGDHGLLCVGSEQIEPFGDVERHLLDILSSTATAALDRVARESELENRRQELQKSNEALQRRREQMDFFNSILRHDILNGMNVIRARGELLAGGLEGQEAEYADTIVKWSDDIIDLTRKVRSVLQTLSDDKGAETRPMTLAPVVEGAAERAASMAAGASFEVDVDSDVTVSADDLLHDVFGNILTNAVEHGQHAPRPGETGGGSTISVTVSSSVGDETVTVRVADDGPGVAPEKRTQIFERGEKGTDSGGTGFGLYFVETMIDGYGGAIRVEESESGGAAFVVELPRVS